MNDETGAGGDFPTTNVCSRVGVTPEPVELWGVSACGPTTGG